MNYSALISVLITVESGGQDMAIGDGTRARGPLQIHAAVVEDVNRFAGTSYSWKGMTNRVAARQVCYLYLQRYAKGKSDQDAARIWNGGPTGPSKTATKRYWLRVSREIRRQQKGGAQ
jgi:hypothetical protein